MLNLTFLNNIVFQPTDERAYWKNIEKMFGIVKFFKVKRFQKYFPHDILQSFCLDDEWKIEMMANRYGYEIVDEDIRTNRTGYTFGIMSA